MPVLSNFYGITIKMYFQQSEHNPPHIHAIYGECSGIIDIQNNCLIEGDLPKRALNLIQEWINFYKQDLIEIWSSQNFRKIPPLK